MASRSSGPIRSGSMFLSAAIFAAIVAAISVWIAVSERAEQRVLATGRRTTVTVVDKQRDKKRSTPTVRVRLDDVPREEPFWRVLRDPEWERVKAGDRLAYVYEPGAPRDGVLGDPRGRQGLGGFLAAGSVFVVPFLIAGIVFRRRELTASAAASYRSR